MVMVNYFSPSALVQGVRGNLMLSFTSSEEMSLIQKSLRKPLPEEQVALLQNHFFFSPLLL